MKTFRVNINTELVSLMKVMASIYALRMLFSKSLLKPLQIPEVALILKDHFKTLLTFWALVGKQIDDNIPQSGFQKHRHYSGCFLSDVQSPLVTDLKAH